jgi:prepilin-type N-terminal cleavage/methylation domain-containing protein
MYRDDCPLRALNFNTRATVRGFTLIETVVALALLALTLTVVYQSFGWTLRRGAEQRQRDWAWLTAQTILNQIRGDGLLTTGHQNGRTAQGLTWESTAELYAPPPPRANAPSRPIQLTTLRPLQVSITVSWGKQPARRVELRSIEFEAGRQR